MSYPDYPKNRLIVNGVDLTTQYSLILTDDYELNPPEPKVYEVDIPGGDGKIDLTQSLLGDTAYDNRSMTFTFYAIDCENFEKLKTEVSNFLHGKSYDFQLTMDPGYTYHGRFKVSSYSHEAYSSGIAGIFKMEITANPFKYLPDKVYNVNGVGGILLHLNSGRKRVSPTVENDGYLKVIFDNKQTILQQGTWTLNDVLFKPGVNELYLNTYNVRNLTWGDLKTNNVTVAAFKTKRLFEWYKSNGDGTIIYERWADEADKSWSDLSTRTWGELSHKESIPNDIKNVYVKYKVGDL